MKRNKPPIYFAMGSSANRTLIVKILKILSQIDVKVIAPVKFYLKKEDMKLFAENIHLYDFLPALETSNLENKL